MEVKGRTKYDQDKRKGTRQVKGNKRETDREG